MDVNDDSPSVIEEIELRLFGRPFAELDERLSQSRRLWRAVHLMVDRELTLTEIADQTGFDELGNFRRHFLKRLEERPRPFRESLLASKSEE